MFTRFCTLHIVNFSLTRFSSSYRLDIYNCALNVCFAAKTINNIYQKYQHNKSISIVNQNQD